MQKPSFSQLTGCVQQDIEEAAICCSAVQMTITRLTLSGLSFKLFKPLESNDGKFLQFLKQFIFPYLDTSITSLNCRYLAKIQQQLSLKTVALIAAFWPQGNASKARLQGESEAHFTICKFAVDSSGIFIS